MPLASPIDIDSFFGVWPRQGSFISRKVMHLRMRHKHNSLNTNWLSVALTCRRRWKMPPKKSIGICAVCCVWRQFRLGCVMRHAVEMFMRMRWLCQLCYCSWIEFVCRKFTIVIVLKAWIRRVTNASKNCPSNE